jgi:hypothetical protein
MLIEKYVQIEEKIKIERMTFTLSTIHMYIYTIT